MEWRTAASRSEIAIETEDNQTLTFTHEKKKKKKKKHLNIRHCGELQLFGRDTSTNVHKLLASFLNKFDVIFGTVEHLDFF